LESFLAGAPFILVLATAFGFGTGSAFPSDCNRNGVDDLEEIQAGAAQDCDGNSVPDACELSTRELFSRSVLLPASTAPATAPPTCTVVLDLEGDGDLDLAMARSQVVLLENQGGLKFQARSQYLQNAHGLAAGDLDGDGDPDLVASNPASGPIGLPDEMWTLFNRGDGGFAGSLITRFAHRPSGVALADLDLDGDLDLVAAGDQEVPILRNNGEGLFDSQLFFPLEGAFPASVAAVDLDRDGDPDVAYSFSERSVVLWNLGEVNFQAREVAGLRGDSLTAVDLDGDRAIDLVTELNLARNQGRGKFAPAETYHQLASPGAVTAGDLDRDGRLDIALTSTAATGLTVLFQEAGGAFAAPVSYPAFGQQGVALAGADLEGDGAPEVVVGAVTIIDFSYLHHNHDCNRNGKLDACDLAAGASGDCDRNGIPDECEPDCNANGIDDTCEAEDGRVPDCNRNSIPDSCEIERGTALDTDGDGVPDECEEAPSLFAFGFEGYPLEVRGSPGDRVTFEVFANLTTTGNPSAEGAQGWSYVISVDENGSFSGITLDGVVVSTVYDADLDGDPSTPPSHLDPYFQELSAPEVFTRFAKLSDGFFPGARPGGWAISAVVLRAQENMVLQPNGTQRIARLTVDAAVPEGPDCRPVTLEFLSSYREIGAVVTFGQRSHLARLGSATILLCPQRFRRGDANSDGLVDISDPIACLRFLYMGGQTPGCVKAADANDDGQVDISDPVLTLGDLFSPRSGSGIPPPGPIACGTDPSPDELGCLEGFSCL
jgi:VCBS repeat protein